ncbi:acyl-CoA dehydrogenase [Streptomyces pilosus]|uniref:Monooxygenase n=1 Tax=Streptomyces pilosus TaxID=28893 RepID=A0A918C6M2_9ACTN|nr:acyl-CoA dehydrogenase [Streptomyces pilosus]GGR07370.1 monooxygenase [Streptomyces pilosus]GGV67715.1 monooxygenase [Streptomyces pilosus]
MAEVEVITTAGDYWRRVADEVADDLAVDAVDRERAGKPPFDEVGRLRESGLPAVLVPPAPDGRGTPWRDACAVVRRIAAADGSVGELLGRHYVLSWSARFFAAPDHADALEARSAREGWLWAGATASPGPLTHGDLPGPVLGPAAGGGHLVLHGHRALPTAVHDADRLVVDAVCSVTHEPVVVVVDARHPRVGRAPEHDRLGQRLTGAGTVHFDGVPVAAADVLGPAGLDEELTPPHTALAPLALALMLTQVALGVAEGALAEAKDLGRRGRRSRPAHGDADVLQAYGELALALHTAAAVTDRATAAVADALAAGQELGHERRADTAAQVAVAGAVTAKAALLTGERVLALTDAEGADRFWRNILALVDRHPAGPTMRAIGDHYLNSAHSGAPSASWPLLYGE